MCLYLRFRRKQQIGNDLAAISDQRFYFLLSQTAAYLIFSATETTLYKHSIPP